MNHGFVLQLNSESSGVTYYVRVAVTGKIEFVTNSAEASAFATFGKAIRAVEMLKRKKCIASGDSISIISLHERLGREVQFLPYDRIKSMVDEGDVLGIYVIKLVNGDKVGYVYKRGESLDVTEDLVKATKYSTLSEAKNDYASFKDFMAFPAKAFLERIVTEELEELV